MITYDVAEAEQLAEVVAIAPPVVVPQVLPEVVQQKLLLLLLLHLWTDADVEVHHEGVDLPALPVLPKPAGRVEQDRLEQTRVAKSS